tara:strand:- start:2 stop:340 length:339 start_codon:yes stop_codon:yes gene_type:complete
MERDGIMNLLTGIWADIKELIKGENKMEDKKIKKYIVMSKFKGQNNFIQDKQFYNRESADRYVELMVEAKDYDNLEYFLFEQSHDYQDKEENWKDLVKEESPMQDFQEVLNG